MNYPSIFYFKMVQLYILGEERWNVLPDRKKIEGNLIETQFGLLLCGMFTGKIMWGEACVLLMTSPASGVARSEKQ